MFFASQKTLQISLREALIIKDKGNIKSAIFKIKSLIDEAPDFFDGWKQLGILQLAVNEHAQALQAFQEAVNIKPCDIQARLYLVEEYIYAKELDKAVENLNHIFSANPNHTTSLIHLGKIHQRQGDRLKALNCFQRVLETNPNHIWANIFVASEYRHVGNFSAAEQQLLKILDAYPKNFQTLKELGETYQLWNRIDDAVIFFERAAKEKPNLVWLWIRLAKLYSTINRFESAEIVLHSILEINPDNYSILTELGKLERFRGNRENALYWFQLAVDRSTDPSQRNKSKLLVIEELQVLGRLDEASKAVCQLSDWKPESISEKMRLGKVLKWLLRFSDAIILFKEVIEKEPENLYGNLFLAQSLDANGQTNEAIDLLEKAPKSVCETSKAQYQLGELYQNMSNRHLSIVCFENALTIEPKHLWANIRIAAELRDLGELSAAKQKLLDALEHYPEQFNLLLDLGEIERRLNRIEDATSYYQLVERLHSDRPEGGLKIAQVLTESHQFDKAATKLQNLLRQYPNDGRVMMQWGYLEKQRGNRRESLKWFRRVSDSIEEPRQQRASKLQIIDELRDLGQFGKARELANQMLIFDPSDVQVQISLGGIAQQQSEFIMAGQIYSNILEQDPLHVQARVELARTWSHSGKIYDAVDLLVSTHEKLGPQLQVLMLLGHLELALDDIDSARQWFQKAYEIYPSVPETAISLANIMSMQWDIDSAQELLSKVHALYPHVVDIPLQIAQIYENQGDTEKSIEYLYHLQSQFPNYVLLNITLARLYALAGNLDNASKSLTNVTADRLALKKQILQLQGEIAFQNYDAHKAAQHYRAALDYNPTLHERNRLCTILIALGEFSEALNQLKKGTEELGFKAPPGRVPIPLISHPARIIQAIQVNPFLLDQVAEARNEIGVDRLLYLAQIISQEPDYFGSSLSLMRELRHQRIFDKLRDASTKSSTHLPLIPKRIAQYWDSAVPPKEIQSLSQTWQEQNPDYEYQLFSYDDALLFIRNHYGNDDQILTIFQKCEEPASQANFFRLAYLYKMGGFYADIDDRCRMSLDSLLKRNAELIVPQEDMGHIGNNLIGCVPGQSSIRVAFYRAATNLLRYSADGPWFQTGPGLLTSVIGNTLLPYLSYEDYRLWPRLWVLSQAEVRAIVTQHIFLPYKRAAKKGACHFLPRK